MNVLISINLGNCSSTGNIMRGISKQAEKDGYIPFQAYPSGRICGPTIERDIVISSFIFSKLNQILGRVTGYNGCFALITTYRFLRKLDKLKPSIIHLHNLHNCYINIPMLFRYIKQHHISVIWTLHDCWPFTGRCLHFTMERCDKWKIGCGKCPFPKSSYPQAIVDKTAKMWHLKKKWFIGVENMTIVTPSQWLANLVKESFLRDYPVKVINNGIDLSVFKPTESNFRQKYRIGSKYILLGVADSWGDRKGLDVFIELSKKLDSKKFQIVLVGTNENIDKLLSDNIISVHRTQNQKELAKIYTAADLFVNPTREDNFPTVNMESIACGTPVLTFRTGGSVEILDESCGAAVNCDDLCALESEIIRFEKEKPFTLENCLLRSRQFDQNKRFKEYIELYKKLGG